MESHDDGIEDDWIADFDSDAVSGAMLLVRRGPNAGARYVLDRDAVRVGRHPDSDIFLDDITVSRRHAEIRREGRGLVVVKDVGSLNGTYVNRERVDEAVLEAGDEVQIGKFRLVYVADRSDEGGENADES
ncbi:MAG: FHA domain-containing protein [Acidimicrobiales bacterium]